MNEPKVERDTPETVDMDAHLDAAIRELDRIRRVGDAPVTEVRADEAASIQGGDADLESDLFDEEPAKTASSVPLLAPESSPAMEPEPEPPASIVDVPSAGATIEASMSSAIDKSEAQAQAQPHVSDSPVTGETPAAHEAAAHEIGSAVPLAAESTPTLAPEPVASRPASAMAQPPQSESAPLPQRMFGLRRALEAHRQGTPADFPERIEPVLVTPPPRDRAQSGEPAAPESAAPSESVAEPVKAAAPARASSAAIVPIVAAAPAVVASRVADAAPEIIPPEPAPKPERRGWFSFRRVREPEPVATPEPVAAPEAIAAPEPVADTSAETVDLTPVREAMAAAAAKRAQGMEVAAPEEAEIVTAVPAGSITPSPMPHPSPAGRVGVLLINLGTPEAPTARAVRNYLREFLADKRVIEKDSFLWQLVLRGIILPWRPRFKARSYRTIWNRVNDESPLKTVTRAQATKLGEALAKLDGSAVVDWAMRYGHPSIEERLRYLMSQGCGRILIAPLYPQYSSATTATACDEVFRVLSRIRNQPAVRFAPAYYADPVYIDAVAASIKAEVATLPFAPEAIVASFHGMPLDYVQKGDPYYNQCVATARLLRERLGMNEQNFILTFQSRFGRAEWLQPYTIETLRKLAKDGVKNVAVVTPGFSADCLETLEEIAVENAHAFKKKGGKNFAFIPCLNDSERGMQVIWDIATRELKGWV